MRKERYFDRDGQGQRALSAHIHAPTVFGTQIQFQPSGLGLRSPVVGKAVISGGEMKTRILYWASGAFGICAIWFLLPRVLGGVDFVTLYLKFILACGSTPPEFAPFWSWTVAAFPFSRHLVSGFSTACLVSVFSWQRIA